MEIISQNTQRVDRPLLSIAHLSQLLSYFIGFGGLITPLIIWLVTKDSVQGMDEHGKAIVNFQLSLILYVLICIPGILLLGLGLLGLVFVGIVGFILPIVNAIRAGNGESPSYFMTIPFIS